MQRFLVYSLLCTNFVFLTGCDLDLEAEPAQPGDVYIQAGSCPKAETWGLRSQSLAVIDGNLVMQCNYRKVAEAPKTEDAKPERED